MLESALGLVLQLTVGSIAVGAGIGIGMVGGFLVSRMRKSESEEIRKKLQECGSELNDSSKVFKSCKEVLLKSKEELKELQTIVSELEQFLQTET